MEKEISQAVIRRMPRYYRYLGELLEEGVERISSNDLSHRMMVTASQIRQDLNNFGGFGQQGYGYNAVSYTHLDVYKRQPQAILILSGKSKRQFPQRMQQLSLFPEKRGLRQEQDAPGKSVKKIIFHV